MIALLCPSVHCLGRFVSSGVNRGRRGVRQGIHPGQGSSPSQVTHTVHTSGWIRVSNQPECVCGKQWESTHMKGEHTNWGLRLGYKLFMRNSLRQKHEPLCYCLYQLVWHTLSPHGWLDWGIWITICARFIRELNCGFLIPTSDCSPFLTLKSWIRD